MSKIKATIFKVGKRDFFVSLFIVLLFLPVVLLYPLESKALPFCLEGILNNCDDIKSIRCDACYCPDNIPYCPGAKCQCGAACPPTTTTPPPPPSGDCKTGPAGERAVCLAKDRMNGGAVYVLSQPAVPTDPNLNPDTNPPMEFDCSGLVSWTWFWGSDNKNKMFGHSTPTNGCCDKVSSDAFAGNLSVGDVAWWSDGANGGHVALYEGGGMIIEAANPTDGLIEEPQYDGSGRGLIFQGWYRPH